MNLISICLSVGTSIFQLNYEPNVFLRILKHLIIRQINLVSIVCLYVSLSKDFTIWHTDLVAYKGENIEQIDSNCTVKMQESLEAYKTTLSKSRTAKLWLQYMEMVELLQKFIKAERTGNWPMKLETTRDMCEFLAAAGRNSY